MAPRHGRYLLDWRVSAPGGYEPARDRAAPALYVRYNTTDKGVRVMRRRTVFVFRRAVISSYPVDGTPSEAVRRKPRESEAVSTGHRAIRAQAPPA